MSKNDKTFTDFDIIRLACLNLTRNELRNVIFFFMIGVPLILASEQLELLFTSIKVPKTLVKAFKLLLRFFINDSLVTILEKIGFKLTLAELIVIVRIIKRLQKLFPR